MAVQSPPATGPEATEVRPEADQLNLGCGDDYRDDWRNADIDEDIHADDYFNAGEAPWPYAANSFDRILAKHSFEHLTHDQTCTAFREAGRVLNPNGTLEVRVPFGADDRTDPTHETTWDWLTPERFTRGGEYAWETGALPFELVEKDANAWVQPPPSLLSQLRWKAEFHYNFSRHGPGRWITGFPFVSGEIIAVYRRCLD